jgi:hypothetical protein
MAPAAGHLVGRDDLEPSAAGGVVRGRDGKEMAITVDVRVGGRRAGWRTLGRRAGGQLGRRRFRNENELGRAGICGR